MRLEKLPIEGAWIRRFPVHADERGFFREWFKASEIESEVGRSFEVEQSNISVSHAGVLRGIHYSVAPKGQGKWITCVSGSIWDVVVDIRPSSSTFKKWIGINLSGQSGDAVFISQGLGHAFMAMEDNSAVAYLLTSPYSPEEEFEINPLDPALAIEWPMKGYSMSSKDASAPTLAERLIQGKLPE